MTQIVSYFLNPCSGRTTFSSIELNSSHGTFSLMDGKCTLTFTWAEQLSKSFEPQHDKTNKMTCAPSKDSDYPGQPPSLIRVFAVHSMGNLRPKVSSCGQQRLIRLADTQAYLSLCWAHITVYLSCCGSFASLVKKNCTPTVLTQPF